MRYRTKAGTVYEVIIHIIMILVVLACIIPFIYMFALSTSSNQAIINNRVGLLPVGFNLNAYRRVFEYPNFFRAYGYTIFYTVFGTAISLVVSLIFAYPLSKTFLRGRKLVLRLVIISMFFNGGLIPNYLLINSLGLSKTVFAMLIPFAINQFNLIILINFLRSLPEEIEEAAVIDGMGYFGILWRIVVPLSTPVIATVGLYTAVFFWNDWFNAHLYLNTKLQPVMLILRNIVLGASNAGDAAGSGEKMTMEMSSKSAVILVSVLPIIILYPFLQRFFVKGLTIGSVKG